MRRILHITNYYYPHIGGIESTTRDVVNVFKQNPDIVQKVICFGDGPHIIDEIPIVRVRYLFKFRSQAISFKYLRILKKTLKEFKPDVVFFHTPNPLVELYFQRCKYDGKLVVYHHLDIERQKVLKHLVKPIEYGLKKKADIVITSSQQYIDGSVELQKFKDKCRIIPLCYKENDFLLSPEETIEVEKIREKYKDKTILFFSGRHTKFKGLHLAIQAAEQLDNVVFVVGRIGDQNRHLEKLINKAKNVVYLGLVGRRDYVKYLHACDIYLFPSLTKNEAFPITLVEVISRGKSPVTFTIKGSGVNFISIDKVTGLECANGNVEEFKEAIERLIRDKRLREQLSVNGIERARKLFNLQQFTNSFNSLLKEILNK